MLLVSAVLNSVSKEGHCQHVWPVGNQLSHDIYIYQLVSESLGMITLTWSWITTNGYGVVQ